MWARLFFRLNSKPLEIHVSVRKFFTKTIDEFSPSTFSDYRPHQHVPTSQWPLLNCHCFPPASVNASLQHVSHWPTSPTQVAPQQRPKSWQTLWSRPETLPDSTNTHNKASTSFCIGDDSGWDRKHKVFAAAIKCLKLKKLKSAKLYKNIWDKKYFLFTYEYRICTQSFACFFSWKNFRPQTMIDKTIDPHCRIGQWRVCFFRLENDSKWCLVYLPLWRAHRYDFTLTLGLLVSLLLFVMLASSSGASLLLFVMLASSSGASLLFVMLASSGGAWEVKNSGTFADALICGICNKHAAAGEIFQRLQLTVTSECFEIFAKNCDIIAARHHFLRLANRTVTPCRLQGLCLHRVPLELVNANTTLLFISSSWHWNFFQKNFLLTSFNGSHVFLVLHGTRGKNTVQGMKGTRQIAHARMGASWTEHHLSFFLSILFFPCG